MRTWKPLPFTYTLHNNFEDALKHFFRIFDEYMEWYDENTDSSKMRDNLSLEKLSDMVSFHDTKIDDFIAKYRKDKKNVGIQTPRR